MPLEIAFNYGIPIALFLIIFVLFLLFKAWKVFSILPNKSKEFSYNISWWVTTLIIIISHVNDITYYDGKISILIWIFLSGLRLIIYENNITFEKSKSEY